MMNVDPILVVDDDTEFRELVCEALSSEGYCALGVASGALALEMLERVHPALAIVDVNMPRMTGPELVREAQERGTLDPRRVVMISAWGCDCASAASWRLAKPFDICLLLRVVEDLCGTGKLAPLWTRRAVGVRMLSTF